MAYTIPDKSRPEWKQMIAGDREIQYSNFVLQMQLTQMRKSIGNQQLTYDKAIDQLHSLCSKYAAAVQRDLKQIFKTW